MNVNMTTSTAAPSNRLLSLDILRGITIAFMIMVNYNGGIYNGAGGTTSWWFMNHAEWIGLTPTDLVFPTFLFVIGVSIVFAFEARLAKGATKPALVKHTVSRTIILIFFGFLVNNFPFGGIVNGKWIFSVDHLRFYGVLQRLAICYLVVGIFYLYDKRVSTKIYALIGCLVAYFILLRWVPVPGHGVQFLDPNFNLVNWLDQHLMPYHLYEDWTTHNLRDPEGLLSTLPAFGTALLGVLTGIFLRTNRAVTQKARGLAVGALLCLTTGYVWSFWFPLSKKMWTSSYTLVAAGYSLALFALVYWLVEVMNWRKVWSWPWIVFGSNAIVAYMFSELFPSVFGFMPWVTFHSAGSPLLVHDDGRLTTIFGWWNLSFYNLIPAPHWAAFGFCLSYLAVCFIPVWILWKKKIFVKI